MPGLGTIANAAAVIAGSLIGLFLCCKVPERIHSTIIKALGLLTIGIGIKLFLEGQNIILIMLSLLIGGLVGEILEIEKRLDSLGAKFKKIIKTNHPTFIEGFVATTIVYCVGPMAVLGSIADGISSQHDILFAKSILDGVASIGFAAGLGVGVLFSSIPIILYQGSITLVAFYAGTFLTDVMIAELSATGGLLIIGIGINLVRFLQKERRIPVGNLLPAIAFAILFVWIKGLISN